MTKIYFDSEELAWAYSAAVAYSMGCNMVSSIYAYEAMEDEGGWYLEVEMNE